METLAERVENKNYIRDLIRKAMALPLERRSTFLKEQCKNDKVLLKDCQSLLMMLDKHHKEGALIRPKSDPPTESTHQEQLCGKYRLEKKLGSGGMADVYLATRTDGLYNQPVALKLVRGWGNAEQLVARFDRERKILASLKHPNIARIMDGGVAESGRPFYVMEFIEGKHINEFCHDQQLSIDERLKLFLKVCAAVASAHQQLVIHRDLKPGNILVTPEGEVKLLDFGIAKLLDPESTDPDLSVLNVPLTPRYTSPEQVRRETLSTAADQYSLGVLLYELLSGCSPYEGGNVNLFKKICNVIPQPPSNAVMYNVKLLQKERKKFRRQLSGDLDTIILKTLNKDPHRRYRSVQQLAEDIERYRCKMPIVARKDSFVYSSKRFIQRNLVLTSIISVAIVSVIIQQLRVMQERDLAYQERQNAEQNAALAWQVQDFIIDLFRISDPGESKGNSVTAREILDSGVDKIKHNLSEQPKVKSELLNTMGIVYRELGLYATSSSLLEEALQIRVDQYPQGSIELAQSLNEFGNLQTKQGNFKHAEKLHQQALGIYLNLPVDKATNLGLADTYYYLGMANGSMGDFQLAGAQFKKVVTIKTAILGHNHPDLAEAYNGLAKVYLQTNNYQQSINFSEKAVSIAKQHLGENHPNTADYLSNLGLAYYFYGDLEKALEYFNRATPIFIQTLGENHRRLAQHYDYLGYVFLAKARFEQAIQYHQQAASIYINSFGEQSSFVARTYLNIGSVHNESENYVQALFYNEKSLNIAIDTLGEIHPLVGVAYSNLGMTHAYLGNYDKAKEFYDKALSINFDVFGEEHFNNAATYDNFGKLYELKGDYSKAIDYYNQAIAILSKTVVDTHPNFAEVYPNLAGVYLKQGDNEQARDYYRKALSILQLHTVTTNPKILEIQKALEDIGG